MRLTKEIKSAILLPIKEIKLKVISFKKKILLIYNLSKNKLLNKIFVHKVHKIQFLNKKILKCRSKQLFPMKM